MAVPSYGDYANKEKVSDITKRNISKIFHFPTSQHGEIYVCKTMFLHTLGF